MSFIFNITKERDANSPKFNLTQASWQTLGSGENETDILHKYNNSTFDENKMHIKLRPIQFIFFSVEGFHSANATSHNFVTQMKRNLEENLAPKNPEKVFK